MKKVWSGVILFSFLMIIIITAVSFIYQKDISRYNQLHQAIKDYNQEEKKAPDNNIYFMTTTITDKEKQQLQNEPSKNLERDQKSTEQLIANKQTSSNSSYYVLQFKAPVKDSWKKALESYDVSFYNYIPQFSFIVKIPDNNLNAVKQLPFVNVVLPYKPEYKINTQTILQTKEDKNKKITLDLYPYQTAEKVTQNKNQNLNQNLNQLKQLQNTEVIYSDDEVIRIKTTKENLNAIASLDGIESIDTPAVLTATNDLAANIHEVHPVWDYLNLNGENQTIGIIDTGLDTGVDNASVFNDTLLDFDNRIIRITANNTICALSGITCSSPNDLNGHGTHVTGSAAGNGTLSAGLYRGMAYKANISFYAAGDDSGTSSIYLGTTSTYKSILNNAYLDGIRVHSNSYGGDSNTYESLSVTLDDFMWTRKDIQFVIAAGNSGASGVNTVLYPGTAKNVLTIGATQSSRSSGNPVAIASFSSLGPAADNRTKPDVVVAGTNIASTKSTVATGGACTSTIATNANYSTCSGTSMATPLAAGMVILIRQDFMKNKFYSNISAALLKATIINGAQELSYGFPSNTTGWGRVNLTNTIMPPSPAYMQFIENNTGVATGGSSLYNITIINKTAPIKITLVWTDFKGTANAAISLVNDLNLVVKSPNGTVFYGNNFQYPFNNSFDNRNNVEQVIIYTNNSQIGDYEINVSGFNIAQGSTQPFSLAISAGTNATPQITKYNGMTTNFNAQLISASSLYNLSNIILENTTNGKIIWYNATSPAFQDFDSNINITRNSITINATHLHSTLNSAMTISLYNIGYSNPVPLKNNSLCTTECIVLTTSAANLTFNVSTLSNFSSRENASINVWDSVDTNIPYRLGTTYENQFVNFYANYSNTTAKSEITTASCTITFSDLSSPLIYNATKLLFEYNRTFTTPGTKDYNITCTETNFITQTQNNNTIILNSTSVTPATPGNFSIQKLANNTLNISWSAAVSASSYKIFIDDNASYLVNLSTAALPTQNITITQTQPTYYIDNDARNINKRYYRLAAVNGTNYNLTTNTIGKFNILIQQSAGNPSSGVQLNLISIPLTINDLNISNITTASDNDIIYSYNTTAKAPITSQFFQNSGWYGDFTTVEYGRSYIFTPVATAYNLTIIGEVPQNNYSTTITAATNSAGNTTASETNLLGYYSAREQCNLTAIFSSPANPAQGDRIYKYNTTAQSYQYVQYNAATKIWQGSFACLEAGEGYEIRPSKNSYTLAYSR